MRARKTSAEAPTGLQLVVHLQKAEQKFSEVSFRRIQNFRLTWKKIPTPNFVLFGIFVLFRNFVLFGNFVGYRKTVFVREEYLKN